MHWYTSSIIIQSKFYGHGGNFTRIRRAELLAQAGSGGRFCARAYENNYWGVPDVVWSRLYIIRSNKFSVLLLKETGIL